MPKQKERPLTHQDEETIKSINKNITRYFGGEDKVPVTCSLQDAAWITGLSYDDLNAKSKSQSPIERLPGIRLGKAKYAVLVSELPIWIVRMARQCN